MAEEEIRPAPLSWITVNSFVLAKYDDAPFWPGKVRRCTESEIIGPWQKWDGHKFQYWVVFYNDYTGAWVEEENIRCFTNRNIDELCFPLMKELSGAIYEAETRRQEGNVCASWNDNDWIPRKGDLILAQFEIHPPWPGVVMRVLPHTMNRFDVHFRYLGENTMGVLPISCVWRYKTERVQMTTVGFQNIMQREYELGISQAERIMEENKN